jgi:hypothetical protein
LLCEPFDELREPGDSMKLAAEVQPDFTLCGELKSGLRYDKFLSLNERRAGAFFLNLLSYSG